MDNSGNRNVCSLGAHNYGEQGIPVPSISTGRKSLISRRRILLGITTLAVLLLVILAAGLSDLRFAPAQPLNFGGGDELPPIQQTLAEIAKAVSETPVWQQIALGIIIVSVPLLIIIFLPPELRKRLLLTLFRMTLMAVAILFFFNNFELGENFNVPEEIISPMNEMESTEPTIVEPEVFEPKEVAPVWSYAISLAILGAASAGGWYLWRVWSRSQQNEQAPLKEFSRIAKASLDDLEEGVNWEDVIIRSYVQMGEVVKERRGIERAEEMTPHEFVSRLVEAGLPPAPVERLTRLFEFVRYSSHKAGEEEMAEAVGCLNQIATAFGEKLR